jgi:acylpyruvate hydrolase
MKLISYTLQDQLPRCGLHTPHGVVDMSAPLSGWPAGREVPRDVMGWIAAAHADPKLLAWVAENASRDALVDTAAPHFKLLPCVPRPGKIICLGVNYHDHAKEGGNLIADFPAFFFRGATSLVAHEQPIMLPKISSKLDFEAELAVVIGQQMKDVDEQGALAGVFGYTCFNDGSLRDYQKRTSQWTIGKNFDQTGGFGPYLVTADELPAGCVGLHIESRFNGQVMQNANTRDMVFSVATTLSLLSQCLTLEVGDVVVMGTPAGVGYARTPPVWMRVGDVVEIEIEGIGILRNGVRAAA